MSKKIIDNFIALQQTCVTKLSNLRMRIRDMDLTVKNMIRCIYMYFRTFSILCVSYLSKVFNQRRKKAAIVVTIWESTKTQLCSKLPLFKTSWKMLRVLSHFSPLGSYLPYLKAFQWDTVWPYTSWCIKNTTGQSWNFYFYQVNLGVLTLNCHIF